MVLNNVASALAQLLILDAIFVLILVAIVAAVSGFKRVAFAVMKRNFVGYFSNPTGYVFLCIFVFLTSMAAFWPYQFFNANLATLDQLNAWYPLIMLVFIPAITMSIWAEERRQGTDELLLTLPADDFDIVIGKYLAAAAIFTASLLFSQVSTFITLAVLTEGALDTGLIFTTYLGYWFVGLMMIAIGMIASFLTGNLTVGFILGALFNAPLAFASHADAISGSERLADWIRAGGIARPFDDFGRGVISGSSVVYFVLAASVALYVCMVLIGRRHWTGGKDGNGMVWHYLARIAALLLITGGAVTVFRHRDFLRYDSTDGKVSSLSPATKRLIRELDTDRPIVIDAYISDDIPELYARTRYELVNLLKEFESEAAKRGREIRVNLHNEIELFSEDAALANERFGIEPVTRMVREKGSYSQKQLILGASFRSGLEKVTVPIFEYGIPVEYELVRSINTVARGTRKRLGIVATDARLMGGASMQGMSMQRVDRHPLVDELAKQYDVEAVELDSPLTPDSYDALLAVQPSSLAPPQFDRLVDAIRGGVPVAIFEDPQPVGAGYITPTGAPKQAAGGMFGGGGPEPKGEIQNLWETLELEIPGRPGMQQLYNPDVVWQQHNPYPNLDAATPLWLFIDEAAPGIEQEGNALNDEHPISAGLRQVLAIVAGGVQAKEDATLRHTPLLITSPQSGTVGGDQVQQLMSQPSALMRELSQAVGSIPIAMAIEGAEQDAGSDDESADDESAEADDAEGGGESTAGPAAERSGRPIRAVYVADTDMMLPEFLLLRAEPDQVADLRFQFQNVNFILNTIDWLTGESEYIEVRAHEPIFASLRMIDSVKEAATSEVRQRSNEFQDQFDATIQEAQQNMDKELQSLRKEIDRLRQESQDGKVSQAVLQEKLTRFQIKQEAQQRALDVKRQKSERDRERRIREIQRLADQEVTAIQNQVKTAAVVLPCIPPLIIGVIVFASRRLRERENISKSRLR